MDRVDALARLEAELGRVAGRRGRLVVERWGRVCVLVGRAGLAAPGEVPAWVWGLDRHEADDVVRALVGLAQGGDQLALLAILACLRPGLCALVARTGVGIDDVVAETTVVVLAARPGRRRRVAAGLLLDVRHRFWAQRKKAPELLVGDARQRLQQVAAPGELGAHVSAPERLFELVCGAWRAGDLAADAARLIIETRVLGDTVAVAAQRRGISAKAGFERRRRAEARLRRTLAGSRRCRRRVNDGAWSHDTARHLLGRPVEPSNGR